MSELETKLASIRRLIDKRGLDALYLHRVSSFAWATCGAASYINTATSTGEASLLITRNEQFLITNNIEAPHYEKEEKLKEQGWTFEIGQWYASSEALAKRTKGLRLGADVAMPGAEDLSSDVATLRMNLLPEEHARFQELARGCALAMDAAIRTVRPGMNEYEIAGRLAEETFRQKVQPVVNLIATDERIFGFRHPLPQDKKLDRYAMLVLCGRKWGLVCSITRLVHFGPLPGELKRKQDAVAQIDAQIMAATRPGKTLSQMFSEIQQAYASAGFPDEWQLHHQGGPAGYEPREFVANSQATAKVEAGQVYAWNPSITGVKSEDTILLAQDGFTVLTEIPGWPVTEIEAGGQKIRRPLVLEA